MVFLEYVVVNIYIYSVEYNGNQKNYAIGFIF